MVSKVMMPLFKSIVVEGDMSGAEQCWYISGGHSPRIGSCLMARAKSSDVQIDGAAATVKP